MSVASFFFILLSGEKHQRCERTQTGVDSACA